MPTEPKEKPAGAVVLIQEIFGVDQAMRDTAAGGGYDAAIIREPPPAVMPFRCEAGFTARRSGRCRR